MAKIIEFHVPPGFRNKRSGVPPQQRGKVIEFCHPPKKSGKVGESSAITDHCFRSSIPSAWIFPAWASSPERTSTDCGNVQEGF